jgi:histidinol-phosphatase (PHP family)
VHALTAEPLIDFFIGSVHHVHSIPIDYDVAQFRAAVEVSGSEEKLYEDYYDLQYEMLAALEPKVVGHFDLIRLMSENPGRDVREWKGVWERVQRNLKLAIQQGGWLECNSAALRKGLEEPYPGRVIAEVIYTPLITNHKLMNHRNGSAWAASSPSQTTVTVSPK